MEFSWRLWPHLGAGQTSCCRRDGSGTLEHAPSRIVTLLDIFCLKFAVDFRDIARRDSETHVRESGTSFGLFSGGGGLAMALHAPGFRHLLLNQINGRACRTLRINCAVNYVPEEARLDFHSDRRLSGLGTGLLGVVGGGGELQRSADRFDSPSIASCVDVADYFFVRPSRSVAKKFEASFRISFARRRSFTSRPSACVDLVAAHPGSQRLWGHPK